MVPAQLPSLAAEFSAQVRLTPGKVAIRNGTTGITFAELEAGAHRVAQAIRRCGPPLDAPVLLYLDHGAPTIIAILGVLKAGGFFTALDPTHPERRNRAIAEDAGAGILITDGNHGAEASAISERLHVIRLDDLGSDLPEEAPPEGHSASQACVLYTSGSTGKPKGVVQTHQNILVEVQRLTELIRLTGSDRCSHLLSANVIGGVREIFAALLHGATLYPFDLKTHGMRPLIDAIVEEKITVCRLVPTTLRVLTSSLSAAESLPSLRAVYVGGEALFAGDVDALRARVSGDCLVVNILGTTEAGIFRACTLGSERCASGHAVPAGSPVFGASVDLIDSEGRSVPPGETGEIIVHSRYLSPGYWRRPDLSASSFFHDESAGEPTYRTGDLGYLLPDGRLMYGGRKDQQVQIRGHRVELSEVEGALRSLQGVADAAVRAVQGPEGACELIGYFQQEVGGNTPVTAMRARLQRLLPGYMVPARLVSVESIPRTGNGKTEFNRLPLPIRGVHSAERVYLAPRDEIEAEIASIFQRLLKKSPIGAHDDFFELGGHSLLAVQLLTELEARFQKPLPLSSLIFAATIEALAANIRGAARPTGQSLVPLQQSGSLPPLFCIHGIGGGVLCYRALAWHMGPDQPLYGLQAPELGGYPAKYRSIPELARLYLREVREVQPGGPYHLAGLSFGGNVAWEMAQQLTRDGEQVALLGLLDSRGPGYPRFRPAPLRALSHFQNYLKLGMEERRDYLRLRAKALQNLWHRRVMTSLYRHQRDAQKPLPSILRDVGLAHFQAFQEYERQPYEGAVTLFRARSQPVGCRFDFHNGWKPLALGGLEVIELAGEHAELVEEPYVRELADRLGSVLARERVEQPATSPLAIPSETGR